MGTYSVNTDERPTPSSVPTIVTGAESSTIDGEGRLLFDDAEGMMVGAFNTWSAAVRIPDPVVADPAPAPAPTPAAAASAPDGSQAAATPVPVTPANPAS